MGDRDILELVREVATLDAERTFLVAEVGTDEATDHGERVLGPRVDATMAQIDARRGEWPADEALRSALDQACRARRVASVLDVRGDDEDAVTDEEFLIPELRLFSEALEDFRTLLGMHDHAADHAPRAISPARWRQREEPAIADLRRRAEEAAAIVRELGAEPWRHPSPAFTRSAARLSVLGWKLRAIVEDLDADHPMYLPLRRAERALSLLDVARIGDFPDAWADVERSIGALRSAVGEPAVRAPVAADPAPRTGAAPRLRLVAPPPAPELVAIVRRATELRAEINHLVHGEDADEGSTIAGMALWGDMEQAITLLDTRRWEWPVDEELRAALDHACRAHRVIPLAGGARPFHADQDYHEPQLCHEALADLSVLLGRPRDADAWEMLAPRHDNLRESRARGLPDAELVAQIAAHAAEASRIVRELGPEPWRSPSPHRTQLALRLEFVAFELQDIGWTLEPEHPLFLPVRRAARAVWLLDNAVVTDVADAWREVELAVRALAAATGAQTT